MLFQSLRDWLSFLDQNEMLVKVSRPIVKETELTSLVRLQFRGLPESQRKAWLFENVFDSKGKHYDAKVACGVYASSVKMYAMGLGCEPTRDAIGKAWTDALVHPIPTKTVTSAPAQEVIYQGDDLTIDGKSIEELPVPVECPGFSGEIRTSTQIITKDPISGIRNMGDYSGHIYGKTKLHAEFHRGSGSDIHWSEWRKMGDKMMPAAVIVGGPPTLFYTGGVAIPRDVDELTVCGGFAGEPVEVVKCKTIDLEVPAHAEYIIEGLVDTSKFELGSAFAEYTGYICPESSHDKVFTVTAITRRKDPIYVHIMSQMPPSESSAIRTLGKENTLLKFLRYDCRHPEVLDIYCNEMSQENWCVIKLKKRTNFNAVQVLALAAHYSQFGKYFVAVDEDIDAHDWDSVMWALAWRVQPHRDVRIMTGRRPGLDVSAYRPDDNPEQKNFPDDTGASIMMIDATIKWPYPPTALPRRDYMERAIQIWKELKLPPLELKLPWYGYELGYWPTEQAEDADLIVRGEHYKVGERLLSRTMKKKLEDIN